MTQGGQPKDYEELIRVIHERYDSMSKTYRAIAEYLTQNPNDVAVMSVNSIAEHCGIHASSFVRFAQSLGYSGFKTLQTVFQRRLSTAAPGFEARIEALENELVAGDLDGDGHFLRDLVVRDITALRSLLSEVSQVDMDRAVDLLEDAETIYLIGQLRSAPIVSLLRYVLTMLRKRTVLLDESGGLATHHAKLASKKDLVFAVSFRFYAQEVVNIVEEAGQRGVPILAISDSTLSPLAKNADVLFAVPEREYTFSRSLAAPMCLVQSLTTALAARQQKKDKPRIPTVTSPQGTSL
ncbi:MurR/RpiR family transcriptional regulator [Qingshengfaniella alkalisoli]|uniref:MurR/RpiR family transcriptional regulator n=1 Tax=Qingshengfaniella alkalisoli TaxID=2599296 RepID=A0A5B8I8Z9_9RHOB|nr:MurR/RpiR family transcriptional regulator [Qingshengfaniella alkalisoli]QDY70615.1 MurR/RpiR family transcriptional regulator [Qingshengfaniella alkalisoli]